MPNARELMRKGCGEGSRMSSLYHSPNIVRVIKSISLKWAGRLARMEESKRCKLMGKRP